MDYPHKHFIFVGFNKINMLSIFITENNYVCSEMLSQNVHKKIGVQTN